jgi:hypothetical protein
MNRFARFALVFVALFTLTTLVWVVLAPPPEPGLAPGLSPFPVVPGLSRPLLAGLLTTVGLLLVGLSARHVVRWARRPA